MNRIKELRLEESMSQKDLAIELNVTQPTISSWESGKVDPDHLAQTYLCYIFKCSTDYLMGLVPAAERGERGWSAGHEAYVRDYLLKNFPGFVAREEKEQEMRDEAEAEWLQNQVCEEDPEDRALAMQAYIEDCWEKAGHVGTLEGVEIGLMMESLSQEERQQLVRVARAMFPDAALV